MTPAMAAGFTDRLSGMEDIVQLIDEAEIVVTIRKRVALCA